MSVRSRDPVWLHWIYDSGEGKTKKMRCRYCMENVQLCSTVRCRKHLIACRESPLAIKEYFLSSLNDLKIRKLESKAMNEGEISLIDLSVELDENEVSQCLSEANNVSQASQGMSEVSSLSLGLSESSQLSHKLSDVNNVSQILCQTSTLTQNMSETNKPKQNLPQVNNLDEVNHAVVEISDDDENSVSSDGSLASNSPMDLQLGQKKLGCDELTDLFAKAMITGDVPFSWADNHFLKLFFGKLGSTFALPSADELSGPVFERIHALCRSDIAAKIESSMDLSLVVVLNSSPSERQAVKKFDLNIMLCSLETVWYKAAQIDKGSLKPKVLSKYMESCIRDIGVMKTSAIITPSNTNLALAKDLVCQQWPHIISIDCAAHSLSLLLSDICRLRSLNEILVKSKSVFAEIGVSEILMEKYKEEWVKFTANEERNGRNLVQVSLRLDCNNKWIAIRDMLTKLQRARPVLNNLADGNDSKLSNETKKTIENDDFWVKIDLALKFIDPLVNALTTFDKDTAVISEVVEIYFTVEELFQETSLNESMFTYDEKQKAKWCFRNRLLGKFVNEYHYLANFLDPNYRGRSFDTNEKLLVLVMKSLEKYANNLGVLRSAQDKYEISECLSKFKNCEGVFGLTLLSNRCAAIYWKHLISYPSCKRLALLASKILSIPATSRNTAKIMSFKERHLSDYSSVHCKEKLEKLMMSKWVLERRVKEANDMLQEMQLVSSSPSIRSSVEDDVCRNCEVIEEFLNFEVPFTPDQLSCNEEGIEKGRAATFA